MAIDKNDRNKINYRGETEFSREREYRVVEPKRQTDRPYIPVGEELDAEELRERFKDLRKKAEKLDNTIDELSMVMKIPIDKEKQPKVAYGVEQLDPGSGGEYLSYGLYKDLLEQQEAAKNNFTVDWINENITDDPVANSSILYNKYIEGAQSYTGVGQVSIPKGEVGGPNMGEVYSNMLLNNITSWNENEYHIRQIINWSQGYLNSSPDPAYIPWTFKEDMRRKITEYGSVDDLLGAYTDLTGNLGGAFESASSPLKLPVDLWESLSGKSESDNNFFNSINEIFSMNYGADLICCLVAWAGGLDLKTLYAMRLALQLAANGIMLNWADLFNSIMALINGFFRNLITGQLIAIIDLIFQAITDPIYEWLNSKEDKWQKLFLCTPIDEAINIYVLGGIEAIEKMLTDKILAYWKDIELDQYYQKEKIEKTKKNKNLQDIIDVLDTVIAAVGKSTLCGQHTSPTGDEVQRFMDAYNVGPAWEYEYPEEETPNRFNSFVRETTELTEEFVIDPVTQKPTGERRIEEKKIVKFDTGTASADLGPDKVNIDRCLGKVANEDIFSVQEWMEDIRSREES